MITMLFAPRWGRVIRSQRLHAFHVKRAHAATGECDVHYLLTQWQKFLWERVHIHTMCESFHRVKGIWP